MKSRTSPPSRGSSPCPLTRATCASILRAPAVSPRCARKRGDSGSAHTASRENARHGKLMAILVTRQPSSPLGQAPVWESVRNAISAPTIIQLVHTAQTMPPPNARDSEPTNSITSVHPAQFEMPEAMPMAMWMAQRKPMPGEKAAARLSSPDRSEAQAHVRRLPCRAAINPPAKLPMPKPMKTADKENVSR